MKNNQNNVGNTQDENKQLQQENEQSKVDKSSQGPCVISYDAKKKKFLFVAPFPSVSSSSEPSCASGFPCLASTFHSAFGFPCPSPPTCFGLMPVRAKPEGVWSILWISMLSPCPAMKFSASRISSMSTQPVCHEERKKKKNFLATFRKWGSLFLLG